MAKTICTLLGAVLLLVGICGFVAPGMLGTHLSLVHNLIHIVSGAAALYLGLSGTLSAARAFCLGFGAVYLLLGIVGFLLGGPGTPSMPNMAADTHLFRVVPNILELGTMDHIIHLLLGILFLIGGLLTKAYVTTSRD